MTLVTIRETGKAAESFNAAVIFDRQGDGYPITIKDPYSRQEEERLEWYFEEYPRFPFLETVRANKAAVGLEAYGKSLFNQVFGSGPKAYALYLQALQTGGPSFIALEIVGSPKFQAAGRGPSPRCVAGSGGYPEAPGSFGALAEHLALTRDTYGPGYYHVIHFDLHGAVLTHDELRKTEGRGDPLQFKVQWKNRPGGRGDLDAYDGEKAFLFFEGTEAEPFDPAEASEVADLLTRHQLPIAILNACQSGRHVEGADATESSLAGRLLQAGVKTVLAMSYSVTVSAAKITMESLYRELFKENDLSRAVRQGRYALYGNKERRAGYNQRIHLEDWMLPVVFQRGGIDAGALLPIRQFTIDEEAAWYASQEILYRAPKLNYEFVGRDVDILEIEKMLLRPREGKRRNLLLIRGMGGAGKTSLLHHLGEWWQTTRFVREVFYFGYDEKGWTLDQILDKIAVRLFGSEAEPRSPGLDEPPALMKFRAMTRAAKKQMVAKKLRATRHLLILDNLESITGAHLAIRHTLPSEERDMLRAFLADLADGETPVLLGSRGGEGWLMEGPSPPLRKNDVYDLPGLDAEAVSILKML